MVFIFIRTNILSCVSFKFSCKKYTRLSDGNASVVQKSETDCNRLGPVTSGFNEAACDMFQGTWCPSPRDCSKLVNCVNATMIEVNSTNTRKAFLKYLDGAPKIKLNEVGYL